MGHGICIRSHEHIISGVEVMRNLDGYDVVCYHADHHQLSIGATMLFCGSP